MISFASAGASNIVIISRNAERLAEVKKSIESSYSGTKVYTFAASVTDLDKITSIFNEIRLQINEPDVLILNAGSSHFNASPLSIPPDSFWHDSEVNVKGNLNLVRNFLVPDSLNKGKRILNVSTGAAHYYVQGFSAYGASKAAFVHILMHIQAEYAYKGVRVTSFQPGVIRNDMARQFGFADMEGMEWDDSKSSIRCITKWTCFWRCPDPRTMN